MVTMPLINPVNPKQMRIEPPIAFAWVLSREGLKSNTERRPPTNIMIPRTITTPVSSVFDFIRIDTFGKSGAEYFNLLVV